MMNTTMPHKKLATLSDLERFVRGAKPWRTVGGVSGLHDRLPLARRRRSGPGFANKWRPPACRMKSPSWRPAATASAPWPRLS